MPHFATLSYAFCKRFLPELVEEIFENFSTNKAVNNRMVNPEAIFIDGIHIKARNTHIWHEYLDLVEQIRKTERDKELYDMRKETIERVFADTKEKHAMRYTHHRGLARITTWVRLKFATLR